MSVTTKLHHICVVVFMVYNLYTDYAVESGARRRVAPLPAAHSFNPFYTP